MPRASGSAPAQPRPEAPMADEVSVEVDSYLGQTNYSIARDGCRIRWQVYSSEINRGVIAHRCDCRLPLSDQAPLLAALLERLVGNPADPGKYHTLFWGRLYPDGKPSPELAMRLMLAAKRSAGWDSVRGSPASGDNNGFVRDLLNRGSAFDEVQSVFRRVGLRIRISSVEKVLVLRAEELPFFNLFSSVDIKAADKLPFDCMVWMSITALAPQPHPRNP